MIIYKYPLRPGTFEIEMPEGARILSVAVQDDKPMMWALVDPSAPLSKHGLMVVGTGHNMEGLDVRNWRFVGTFQLDGGSLVFHLFEFDDSPRS